MLRYLLLAFTMLLSGPVLGQQFFRLKADFSIKENLPDGKQVLTMGTVYFDRNAGKLVYVLDFPRREIHVLTDSVAYELQDGRLVNEKKAMNLLQFSIFNLALSANLHNYGLSNNGVFKLSNVEKQDSLVVSTWSPSIKKIAELTGDVLVATKDKRLHGLVFYDQNKRLMSKQFFSKYTTFKGLAFPGEILQINYIGGKEYYKITTYKNVIVNAQNENEFYNYVLPAH